MNSKNRPIAVAPLFTDGMVLQRDADVKIWGSGQKGEELQIEIAGQSRLAMIDEQGNWEASFSCLPTGGPYRMSVTGYEKLVIEEVYVGDVWLLGGQSNMELPVERTLDLFQKEVSQATNPLIRQFSVPQIYDFTAPRKELAGGKWQAVTPQTVLEFSAVGYFFAQALYEKYRVPQGLILTAVGGTPIEAWLSEETLNRLGLADYGAVIDRCRERDYIQSTMQAENKAMHAWHKRLNAEDPGLNDTPNWFEPDFSDTEWPQIDVPGTWSKSDLSGFVGSVWLRQNFTVPPEMANEPALLHLGAIIDADQTYLNGKLIGRTEYKYPPRRYQVPAGILRPGENTLAVRVIVNGGTGGFVPEKKYALVAEKKEIPLDGPWKYKKGAPMAALPMQTFFQFKPTGVYNAMLAPLHNCTIKGILWYQGESNAGAPERYVQLFEALVSSWRHAWGEPELPFLFVQLPNFAAETWEFGSKFGWAEFRDAQQRGLSIPNTAMAVTIDLGEANDLHPQNKKGVGERLALLARRLIFGEDIVATGPVFSGLKRCGGALEVSFETGGTLVAAGEELVGFEVCGADRKFYPAEADVAEDRVIVRSCSVEVPCGVRYAWANNPEANLYNDSGLPAAPFRAEVE